MRDIRIAEERDAGLVLDPLTSEALRLLRGPEAEREGSDDQHQGEVGTQDALQKMYPQFMNATDNRTDPTPKIVIAQNAGNNTATNLGTESRGRSGNGYERMRTRLRTTYTRYGFGIRFHPRPTATNTTAVSARSTLQ